MPSGAHPEKNSHPARFWGREIVVANIHTFYIAEKTAIGARKSSDLCEKLTREGGGRGGGAGDGLKTSPFRERESGGRRVCYGWD